MTSEAGMQGTVMSNLRKHGVRVTRISNTAEPGTPDLAFVANGRDGWIELKLGKIVKGELRVSTQTAQQRLWMREHAKYGGNAFTLVRLPKLWLLYTAKISAEIHGISETDALLLARWKSGVRVDWEKFTWVLS